MPVAPSISRCQSRGCSRVSINFISLVSFRLFSTERLSESQRETAPGPGLVKFRGEGNTIVKYLLEKRATQNVATKFLG